MHSTKNEKPTIKQFILVPFLAVVLIFCFFIVKLQLNQKYNPIKIPRIDVPTTQSKTINEQLARQSKIGKFNNYDELKAFLEESSVDSGNLYYSGLGGERRLMKEETAVAEVAVPTKEMPGKTLRDTLYAAESSDFSTTNIQVENVDEADIIKTDGKYIYAVSKNNLFIIDGYPAKDSEIVSKIEFKSTPQDIYIQENSLIIYGTDNNIYNSEVLKRLPPSRRYSQYTFFKVFDIADKKNPKQVRDLDFEGNYTDSRMIGNYVYFVTTAYNYSLDDNIIIPKIIENGEVLSNDKTDARCNCPDVYYFDIPYQQYNFTSIAAVNIADNSQKIANEIYLLAGNQNMYVSKNNIYFTYTKYISEEMLAMEALKEIVFPKLNERERDKIAKIEAVDNFILSKEEKMAKIGLILQRYSESLSEEGQKATQDELQKKIKKKYKDISKELEKTVIHKIAINDSDLVYQNFGEITGQVLNQFSMDENNGYFRIATTKNQTWSQFADEDQRESYNNLYVLDKDLKIVGAVENLAQGERIYSVRFMQDRAYMVTFQQTDPLFVVDLKDPKAPKILGKLKIPGFSNYLHPYDNGTLIGLGRETKENEMGVVTSLGIKLSLFDVSDVENPKEIDKYVIGDHNTSSIALDDHKAFLFSRDKNLLVIPITKGEEILFDDEPIVGCGTKKCIDSYVKNLAVVFTTDKNGFKLKGEIDHYDGVVATDYFANEYRLYDTAVQRSLYIDDVLYTFSNKYLKMNNLNDLKLVKTIEITNNNKNDFEIIN